MEGPRQRPRPFLGFPKVIHLKTSLRTALMSATAAVVFLATVWVAQSDQTAAAQEGGAPAQGGRGRGRQAGPPQPTPRLADGTVNFGRVPGEKGTWNVPYITNMAMRVVTGPGSSELVPEIVAANAAAAAARAGGAGRAGGGGRGGGRGGS